MSPGMMTVAHAGDFAFLDLTAPGFDLSDRGVEGRSAPGPVDVFATTERGVYRPGEVVHVTALAREGFSEIEADWQAHLLAGALAAAVGWNVETRGFDRPELERRMGQNSRQMFRYLPTEQDAVAGQLALARAAWMTHGR